MWLIQYLKSFGDNFGRVTRTVYRSAEPSQAQLIEWKHNYALDAVLNLRAEAGLEEAEEVRRAGLLWYPVPMSDKAEPDAGTIANALAVLRMGLVTLVCCKGGRHRTGLVIACYRVAVQGWSKEDAWKEAEKYGFYSALGHGPLKKWFFEKFEGDK